MATKDKHLLSERKPQEWDLANIPQPGDSAVGAFAWKCFEDAKMEKERLMLHERWNENHRIFRARHWRNAHPLSRRGRHKISLGLFFSNVVRTVANITAKEPVAEVKDQDGIDDQADVALSQKIQGWYSETEQGRTLEASTMQMELYGPTVEKYIWDPDRKRPDTVVLDPFSAFPAPGYYENVNDMPYFAHAYPMLVEHVEEMFGIERGKVMVDDVYSIMGQERQENKPIPAGTRRGSTNLPGNYTRTEHPHMQPQDYAEKKALVVELWIRDWTKAVENDYERDPVTGEVYRVEREYFVNPGGIRKITVTNRGGLVLDDSPNPNVNHEMPRHIASRTHLWHSLPFSMACSYKDGVDIWGFSAYEQTRDLILALDELLSRILDHIYYSTNTPWIVPTDTGIPLSKINNRPGLILQPATYVVAQGISRLQATELPRSTFEAFNLIISLFDRIWAIEDTDRGEEPSRVVAASAIHMLQERNAVLIRQKIRAVDYLVRERGRAAISFYQNFGIQPELVEVNGQPLQVQGVALAGRNFKYIVESGSTYAQTTAKTQEDAVNLYKMGAIDRQALLQTLNFPGWREIVERVSEGQVGQALDILVKAGLPEDIAMRIREFVMQPGQGPGGSNQQGGGREGQSEQGGKQQESGGTPKAQQGAQDIGAR